MKKILLPILLMVIAHLTYAQWERKSKLGFSGGYESNVFLNPPSLVVDGITMGRDQLLESGTFQRVYLNNTFVLDTLNHRLKIKANVGASIYQTEIKANRHTYDIGVSYRKKVGRKKYFEIAPEYNRRQRDGVNETDAVIRTPFSFRQVLIPFHFDYYLGKRAWLKTQVGYLFKDYDRVEGEDLYYRSPFVTAAISKKWLGSEATKKLTVTANGQWRKYTDIEAITSNAEDPEFVSEERNWNYIRLNTEFEVIDSENKYRLLFGLYHLRRVDVDGPNGYTQFSPRIQFKYKLKKLTLESEFKYSLRNYLELSPGAENETLLKYNYIRAGLGGSYDLKRNMYVFLKGRIVNRESNSPNLSAIGFRDYFTGFAEVGMVVKF
ncbi:MAG: hypothetical protein ACFB2Y_14155 [Fulvivirga sp.]